MMYTINPTSVAIIKGSHRVELSKLNFNKEILNDSILGELTFAELMEIWKNLYGVPKNVKEILLQKIKLYRKSSNVHSFLYEGKEYWLDKDDRTSLWNLSNSSLGNLEIVIGDDVITIGSIKLKAFLLKLELYAYKCFVNTFKHLKAIKSLEKLEDIMNYNYTTGYPDKVTLE